MNILKVGVLSAILTLGTAGCKKVPYQKLGKGSATKKMEQVVDSFYKEGAKIKNDTNYELIHKDTIELRKKDWEKPNKLSKRLEMMAIKDKTPTEEGETSYLYYNNPKYIVSSNEIYTKGGRKNYIAVEEYDLKK